MDNVGMKLTVSHKSFSWSIKHCGHPFPLLSDICIYFRSNKARTNVNVDNINKEEESLHHGTYKLVPPTLFIS